MNVSECVCVCVWIPAPFPPYHRHNALFPATSMSETWGSRKLRGRLVFCHGRQKHPHFRGSLVQHYPFKEQPCSFKVRSQFPVSKSGRGGGFRAWSPLDFWSFWPGLPLAKTLLVNVAVGKGFSGRTKKQPAGLPP